MDCKNIHISITEYTDGLMSDKSRKLFEEHIACCEKCALKLEQATKMLNSLRNIEQIPLPDGYYAELKQKFEQNTFKEETKAAGRLASFCSNMRNKNEAAVVTARKHNSYMQYAGLAAAVVFVTLIGLGVFNMFLDTVKSDNNEFAENTERSYVLTDAKIIYDTSAIADFSEYGESVAEETAGGLNAAMEVYDSETYDTADISTPYAMQSSASETNDISTRVSSTDIITPPVPPSADDTQMLSNDTFDVSNASPVASSPFDTDETPLLPEFEAEQVVEKDEAQADIQPISGYVPPGYTDGKIVTNVTVEIYTEDLSQTVRAINALPGYTANSDVNYTDPELDRKYGYASILRRVGVNELEYAKGILSGLGDIISENETRTDYTARYSELAVYASGAYGELERLVRLVRESDSLENIVFIETRIAEIDYNLDGYLGQIRQIDAQTSHAYLEIHIYSHNKYEPVIFVEEPKTFKERISKAFGDSVGYSREFIENFSVFTATAVIPVAAAAVFVVAVKFAAKGLKKRKKNNRAKIADGLIEEATNYED